MDLANRCVATNAGSKMRAGEDVFSRLTSAGSTTCGEDVFSRFTSAGSATFGDLSREKTPLTIGSLPIPLTTLDGYSREATPVEGFLSHLAGQQNDKIQPAEEDCSPCTCSTADASPLGPDASPLGPDESLLWVDSWFGLAESDLPDDLTKVMAAPDMKALYEASSILLDSHFQLEAEEHVRRCSEDKYPVWVDSWFAAPEEFVTKEQTNYSGSAKSDSLASHQLLVASSYMMESHFQLVSAQADLITSDVMWEWHTGRTHAGELNISSDDMWEWHTGRTHAGELNISSDDMWEWHTGQTHAA